MVSSSISSEAVLKGTVFDSFKKSVIDKFCIFAGNKAYSYADYLEIPETSHLRHGDEANAVDQQFTLEMLKWLGFDHASWRYNVPQPGTGSKLNRPDYEVRGSIGVAFIVEDKSSVTNFDADQHLKQMQRYCVGTAGYAIWCNMRRIIAIRFLPDNAIKYEILVDISIEKLFGSQQLPPTEKEMQEKEMQIDNLALFQLLFSKERFTNFDLLLTKICVDEQTFKERAIHLDTPQAIKNFIEGSRQSLSHLKLAALSQIQKSLAFRRNMNKEQNTLFHEWNEEKTNLANRINYSIISDPVVKEIDQLTPHLGSLKPYEIGRVREVIQEICKKASVKLATIMPLYEIWEERALRINSALLSQRFDVTEILRTAEAFNVWSERQSDKEDIKSEIFAEQVAYVFFVRLLLIRVLEDKNILHPRLASDGGFLDWSNYVAQHFEELKGIGILNETFCSILSRKASAYYLHFFQQAVFDWFTPDDFLLVETLEFLCQYNLSDITSDIVGFTYEAYIDRNARDRKGHFLTRQDVVEYMLDVLGYVEPEIRTERRILDPACGSGSFLVHAARRYRRALITEFCNINGLPDKEESIKLDSALRKEFARQYVDHLMTSFFGMELNPFACYLAEMNLLIQALDDLFVLQQAGDAQPIERFQIYNTNSLDLPREILDRVDLSGDANRISMPDRLSERLADEAYPIKAGLAKYAEGFFYIISNPPYVSSKQEFKEAKQYRNTDFYTSILSGDANLYLLFLRLGFHYLSRYGRMIYIVPLTIFGDKSAAAARKLLNTPPFSPSAAIRFYRGDILFPGVDQAVGIIRVDHSSSGDAIMVSGGNTIQEARNSQFISTVEDVLEAVPFNNLWQGNWLVAHKPESLNVWKHAKYKSENFRWSLGNVIDEVFDRKQGDINATILNPLRVGPQNGNFANGDVAIYKGEDIRPFTPLPLYPSDWARPLQANDKRMSKEVARSSSILEQLKKIEKVQRGIVLREVARLNTREHLTATWFEREANQPIAFTHELWRMVLKGNVAEDYGKAVLAIINSKVVAYLINLFSTNNHVVKDDLSRVPIPDKQFMPTGLLSSLADNILREYVKLEQKFVLEYDAKLPEFDDGKVYIPPSSVLAKSHVPKLKVSTLVGLGEVKNKGSANGRIKALKIRNLIVYKEDITNSNKTTLSQVLDLFFSEPKKGDDIWLQALNWQVPDTVAVMDWLREYNTILQQAQTSWETIISLKQQVDDVIADWYGFNDNQRLAINEGLPWARRRKSKDASEKSSLPTEISVQSKLPKGSTNRLPVVSSQIYAIGYDSNTATLEIEFLSGEVWQYQCVSPEIYQAFETSPSKGAYFSKEIKGKFASVKL